MGHIYLYTGTGGGKTVNALGLALRSVGHEHKVVIIQFLKWWKNTGEYKIREKLQPYYQIYQFGRYGWKGLDNLGEEDRRLTKEGLEFAKKVVKEKKTHLLILDEINLAERPNENHVAIFLPYEKLAANSDGENISPVPSCMASDVTSISP